MRRSTAYRVQKVTQLLKTGKRTPKEVACILHVTVATIYKDMQRTKPYKRRAPSRRYWQFFANPLHPP